MSQRKRVGKSEPGKAKTLKRVVRKRVVRKRVGKKAIRKIAILKESDVALHISLNSGARGETPRVNGGVG